MARRPDDSAAPLARRTVADVAVVELRERILRGDYAEGVPLRQDAVAAQLGMSRIPVREALRQLEAEGLVTVNPHQGAVVSTLSIPEIGELFELRAMLESDLVRRAVGQLGPVALLEAEAALVEYDLAFARGNVSEWGRLNWMFHSALLGASGRPLTLGVLSKLHNQSERYMRLQLSLTHGERRASNEHHAILKAVREGDAETAAELVRAHISNAGASLTTFLGNHRDAKRIIE